MWHSFFFMQADNGSIPKRPRNISKRACYVVGKLNGEDEHPLHTGGSCSFSSSKDREVFPPGVNEKAEFSLLTPDWEGKKNVPFVVVSDELIVIITQVTFR